MGTNIIKSIGKLINGIALVVVILIGLGFAYLFCAPTSCDMLATLRDDRAAVAELQAVLTSFIQTPDVQLEIQNRRGSSEYRTYYGRAKLDDYGPFDRYGIRHHKINIVVELDNNLAASDNAVTVKSVGFSYGRADLLFPNTAMHVEGENQGSMIILAPNPYVVCRTTDPIGEAFE